ncbi:letm1-like protein [Sporothrix brasiliensis 5110]|uniref:Letm1-like protein n=1 Tax=Sporothrix brasiliensis 5110 TaxID=1398154 RepID=A0A0C2IVS8_9PEZI|nr:letm1-like protein [Sporothrix brasiliensis 5110]KIH89087.1 letm1-like protein [Sporothrix brasiliensis 5110]
MLLPIFNGRALATAGKPSGFMPSVVAAYSSSCHSKYHSTYHSCGLPLRPTATTRSATPYTRTRPTAAFAAPLARPVSSSSTSQSDPSAAAATAPTLTPSAANPPHTTRPPPLTLPERKPETSTFSHLLATGKAYLAFYKTGLRYLFANTKLVRGMDANNDTADAVKAGHATRSDLLLRRRWGHDMRRLPLFGLLLLICGEFTPFVVLVFPHVVPYPCRIPKQVEQLQRKAESRRQYAFVAYEEETVASAPTTETTIRSRHATAARDVLISRSLGLIAPFWDRIGLVSGVPGLAHRAVERHLAFLAEDDALLRQAGGVLALEPEEVLLASADRGLDVVGQDEGRLRERLVRWLQLTQPQNNDVDGSDVHEQMLTLLTKRPETWPPKKI